MSRSVKKGPFVQPRLLGRVQDMNKRNERKVLKTWSRASVIFPDFIGHTIAVYNGRKHVPVYVTENMTMLALPRIRDFRGTPSRSFDGRGNYTLGLREQIAFPEIDYDKVDRLRGLEVSIVTTARSDEESKRLLELLGMPFAS